MRAWNSTLRPSAKPMQRSPMKRLASKKGAGLAQRVAESLGRTIKHIKGESGLLRSETHRRNVAALGCACCGRHAPSQCAHANFGKSMARKQCDSLTFPACPGCHRYHDSGGMPREKRWLKEWEYVDLTRALLIQRNQWPAEIEAAYKKAIQPLARMVHSETEVA